MNEVSLTRFKVCTKCGCNKPATTDFFQQHSQACFRPDCRVCRSLWLKAYRRNNRERILEAQRESSSRYVAKNREKHRATNRRSAAKNRAKNIARAKKWVEDNPECAKQWKRDYYAANAHRWLIYAHDRRARVTNAEGTHTFEEIMQMYEDQQGLCAYCETPLFGCYEVDHMVPISRGGRNDWTNLAIACKTCNRSKWANTVEEFFNQ